MSSGTSLNFTYRYPFASTVCESDQGFGLHLATCGAHQEHPHFFEGRLTEPRKMADMLLVLSNIVRSNFFIPRPVLLDPVVTSSESMLRFEGFSGCCGVYARADLKPEAFESELQNRGATNVDFNNPMRSALSRLNDRAGARLSVGRDQVELESGGESTVEKKVKLPLRWIKGFSEVQAYQPGLTPALEVTATEARKFVRSLKGGEPKRPVYVVQSGKQLRLSPRPARGAVRLQGLNRVKAIEPLLGSASGLRVWHEQSSGVTGWEITSSVGGFFVLISPEPSRGFSGEGQVLEKLAVGDWKSALPKVQAQLAWQNQVDADEMFKLTGLPQSSVLSALAVLGSRGLAGFDVSTQSYFHRILPFELDKVDQLQPRLMGANKLVEENKVSLVKAHKDGRAEYSVIGKSATYAVRVTEDQDKCNCPWFNKYLGRRGPCKHILAARMVHEQSAEKVK